MKISPSIQALKGHALIALLIAQGVPPLQAQSSLQLAPAARIRPAASADLARSSTSAFGKPLPNLTADQLEDFAEGLEEFESEDTPETGLGPVFNNVSCVACHSAPATGGGSALLETRFGHLVNGVFDPLDSEGGSLMQLFAIDPTIQESVPAAANVVALRRTTPLFGLGLIEAIPDVVILQNAKASKPDGVTGRASIVQDVATGKTRVGRFGWKAQQATLLAFAGDAYLNEMGITSRLFPQENLPCGNPDFLSFDLVADPEDPVDPATGKGDIDKFADFMRLLGAPPTVPLTRSASTGKSLFSQIGCAVCHTPALVTGPSPIKALNFKQVPLYSDLLLHNMGSLGDGIAQAAAKPREMRTAPLWGLRGNPTLLHDGRATTVNAAIVAHDGEASVARARYVHLTSSQRQNVLDFLNSN